eukprot:354728-Chlamydomonas_euryale.AAC.11
MTGPSRPPLARMPKMHRRQRVEGSKRCLRLQPRSTRAPLRPGRCRARAAAAALHAWAQGEGGHTPQQLPHRPSPPHTHFGAAPSEAPSAPSRCAPRQISASQLRAAPPPRAAPAPPSCPVAVAQRCTPSPLAAWRRRWTWKHFKRS